LIVVAALGRRRESQWRLGSHAERLAQRSRVPVLVVRAPEALEAWAKGTAPLRIVLGADASLSSEQAMQWVGGLCTLGPCEVTAVHLYWPPEQFRRLGLHGVRSYLEPAPEVTNALERDLGARFASLSGAPQSKLRCEPHIGRIGDRLAAVAAEVGAQLLVVGSHPRTALDRMAEGSVSRDVLHCAGMSVACVPLPADARMSKTPDLHDVLVATDFSPTADAALPLAYAIAPRGSTVHVVHVTHERTARPLEPHDIFSAGAHPEERARLAALVPADATERGVLTELHVLQSNDVPEAICQAAERLNARVLCLGTHGRSGLSKAVLGSVAQKVVTETRRPVLLARKPIE
jgi:nucleotide-binding universal stress UspA family protein